MTEPASPEKPLLNGFALSNLGPVTPPGVHIGPLRRMNFLIGRNNHGKSSVLRAIQLFCDIGTDSKYVSTAMGRHGQVSSRREDFGTSTEVVQRQVLVRLSEGVLQDNRLLHFSDWVNAKRHALEGGLASGTDGDDLLVWVNLTGSPGIHVDIQQADLRAWGQAFGTVPEQHAFRAAMQQAALVIDPLPYAFVPAFREIDDHSQPSGSDLDRGRGLIRELQRWQHPDQADSNAAKDRARFDALTELVRDVLEDDTASILVPYNLRAIQVETRQARRYLDLADLGDGIAQVLMIGAAALRHDNTLICIEEPEIHLHAGLQRKLIRHLGRTTNQYLIATHSASIIDTPGAAIFHVVHDGNGTRVTSAVTVDSVALVCDDLGVRASDVLQANYVVWVEGPADRLYWRQWIELVDSTIQEGVHYVLVSYGGRLVDEVDLTGGAEGFVEMEETSAIDRAEANMLDILRLGRWSSLIADSDRHSPDDELHPTIARLIDEASRSETAEVIVLEGVRTVENLLPGHVLEEAFRKCHPVLGQSFRAQTDPYGPPFGDVNPGSYSKVKVARAAIPLITLAQMSGELVEEVRRLAARIRSVNGLSSPPPMEQRRRAEDE